MLLKLDQIHTDNSSKSLEVPNSHFYRNGLDHRQGWLVEFADVKKTFGFKTLRLGKWVSVEEKMTSAPLFYDALCDLKAILKGSEDLISLRGTLSLDYGIGGQLGTYAHYTPANRCFSLAKNAGPGSIAHEWFHAFDHYIATKLYPTVEDGWFASEVWTERLKCPEYKSKVHHPLNSLLIKCFEAVLLDDTGLNASDLAVASKIADAKSGQRYYSLPVELCARAFEAFVQDSSIKNNFLVKGTKKSDEANQGLYPKGKQRKRINMAFQHYFESLGIAIKRAG